MASNLPFMDLADSNLCCVSASKGKAENAASNLFSANVGPTVQVQSERIKQHEKAH